MPGPATPLAGAHSGRGTGLSGARLWCGIWHGTGLASALPWCDADGTGLASVSASTHDASRVLELGAGKYPQVGRGWVWSFQDTGHCRWRLSIKDLDSTKLLEIGIIRPGFSTRGNSFHFCHTSDISCAREESLRNSTSDISWISHSSWRTDS